MAAPFPSDRHGAEQLVTFTPDDGGVRGQTRIVRPLQPRYAAEVAARRPHGACRALALGRGEAPAALLVARLRAGGGRRGSGDLKESIRLTNPDPDFEKYGFATCTRARPVSSCRSFSFAPRHGTGWRGTGFESPVFLVRTEAWDRVEGQGSARRSADAHLKRRQLRVDHIKWLEMGGRKLCRLGLRCWRHWRHAASQVRTASWCAGGGRPCGRHWRHAASQGRTAGWCAGGGCHDGEHGPAAMRRVA